MPVSEYRMISAPPKQAEVEMAQLAMKGWKPILMSSNVAATNALNVVIILELPSGAGK